MCRQAYNRCSINSLLNEQMNEWVEDWRLHVAISFFPLEKSESVYVGKILSNVKKKKKITGLAKKCVQASPALQGHRNCVPSSSDGTVPLGMEWFIGIHPGSGPWGYCLLLQTKVIQALHSKSRMWAASFQIMVQRKVTLAAVSPGMFSQTFLGGDGAC